MDSPIRLGNNTKLITHLYGGFRLITYNNDDNKFSHITHIAGSRESSLESDRIEKSVFSFTDDRQLSVSTLAQVIACSFWRIPTEWCWCVNTDTLTATKLSVVEGCWCVNTDTLTATKLSVVEGCWCVNTDTLTATKLSVVEGCWCVNTDTLTATKLSVVEECCCFNTDTLTATKLSCVEECCCFNADTLTATTLSAVSTQIR